MYSDEMQRFLSERNYHITLEEWDNILYNSKQISHVKYNGDENEYYFRLFIETTDNYSWTISVKKYGK